MRFETITLCVTPTGDRLDALLVQHFPDVSRSQIQNWIKNSYVIDAATDKPVTQASLKMLKPMTLTINRPLKTAFTPPAAENRPDLLKIIYEDDHLLVINKPVGLSVHPGAGRPSGTLVNLLLAHTEGVLSSVNTMERPGIVHRLDKDTSGLLLVAKTNAVHVALADALKERRVKRLYHSMVWNLPKENKGTIETYIGRDGQNRQRMAIKSGGGKKAITHFQVLENFARQGCLVACTLETGRTHQIRVHMQHNNTPVMCDPTYKTKHMPSLKTLPPSLRTAMDAMPGQALHAYQLGFTHPVTHEDMIFTAPYPEAFERLLAEWRLISF